MRALHAVTAPTTGDRTMPNEKQPTIERVLDGETHTVRMELGPWVHEYLLDLFKTLDADPHLRALVVAEVAGANTGKLRGLRRAHIAHDIADRMSKAGLTTHDMDPAQADDLAEALEEAAVEAAVCRHDSYAGECQNLCDGDYCTLHDGQAQ